MRQSRLCSPLVLFFALLAACGSSVHVTGIQLGRSINADGSVANHTTVFAPDETVYISIATSGVGSATLKVRWVYHGRVLGEPQKRISSRDATTEFHLQSPAGFPPGDYTAEVFLDDRPVDTRTFRVEFGG